jgi:hypothetical protein
MDADYKVAIEKCDAFGRGQGFLRTAAKAKYRK